MFAYEEKKFQRLNLINKVSFNKTCTYLHKYAVLLDINAFAFLLPHIYAVDVASYTVDLWNIELFDIRAFKFSGNVSLTLKKTKTKKNRDK